MAVAKAYDFRGGKEGFGDKVTDTFDNKGAFTLKNKIVLTSK